MRLSFAIIPVLASVGVLACSGEVGPPGPKGDNGDGSEPGVGFVFPLQGLLARDIDVLVSLDGTKVGEKPQLDFGAGITVSNVNVVGASAISAKLTIAKSATLGRRDVTVSYEGGSFVGKSAFEVIPTMTAKVVGAAKQGGLFAIDLVNNDRFPFSPDMEVDGPVGTVSLGVNASSYSGTALFLVEPKAALGPFTATGINPDEMEFYSIPEVGKIEAGTPEALTSGATPSFSLKAVDSRFYKMNYAAAGANGGFVNFNIKTTASSNSSPTAVLFPASGKFQDLIAVGSPPQSLFGAAPPPYDIQVSFPLAAGAAASEGYLIVFEGGEGGPVSLSHTVIGSADITPFAEAAGAHADAASAQDMGAVPVAGKVINISGELTANGEIDVFKFSAAENDKFEISGAPLVDAQTLITPKNAGGTFTDRDALAGFTAPEKQTGTGAMSTGTKAAALDAGKLYIVVKAPADAVKKTGKYLLSLRRLP